MNGQTINVVILFVGDNPKGIWKEQELVSYNGKVWWDYIKPITIPISEWVGLNIQEIVNKYLK